MSEIGFNRDHPIFQGGTDPNRVEGALPSFGEVPAQNNPQPLAILNSPERQAEMWDGNSNPQKPPSQQPGVVAGLVNEFTHPFGAEDPVTLAKKAANQISRLANAATGFVGDILHGHGMDPALANQMANEHAADSVQLNNKINAELRATPVPKEMIGWSYPAPTSADQADDVSAIARP